MNKNLFKLVHSLSKSEKRYFNLYASKWNSINNYLKLFNCIDKTPINILLEDKAYLSNLLKNETFSKHLYRTENYLFHLIFKSLSAYYAEQDTEIRIRHLINMISIAVKKGLKDAAIKLIQKAKKLALHTEQFGLLLEILDFEFNVIEIESLLKRGEILKQKNKILKKLNTINQLYKLNHQLNQFIVSKAIARKSEDITFTKKIMQNHLLIDATKLSSVKATILYYRMHTSFHYIMGNLKQAIALFNQYINWLEQLPKHTIQEYIGDYIGAINNFLTILNMAKKHKKEAILLNKFKAIANKYKLTPVQSDNYYYQLYSRILINHIAVGNFKEGTKEIPQIQDFINKNTIDRELEMSFNFQFATLSMGIENYDNAISYLNTVLNIAKKGIREDLHSYTLILNIICHFELGNLLIVKNLAKTASIFFKKKQQLLQIEHVIIQLYGKLADAKKSDYNQLYSNALMQITDGIEKHSFEYKAQDYFDFSSWIESKIEQKSFKEILKGKLKSEI